VTVVLWLVAFAGAVAGAVSLALVLMTATGAPQEAAGAAIACALAVIPYVLARSWSELLPKPVGTEPTRFTRAVAGVGLAVVAVAGVAAVWLLVQPQFAEQRRAQTITEFDLDRTDEVIREAEDALLALNPPSGDWTKSVSRSPMDDSKAVVLTKRAEQEIRGRFGAEMPRLVLRCSENKTEAYVNVGTPVEHHGRDYHRSRVRVRFDAEPALAASYTMSTSRDALFAPKPIALIRQMLLHDQLVLEVTPSGSGSQTATFDLNGLGDHIGELQEACGWQ